ncbi:MAG TPA: winged helix-turn-helix domain-containing protein [Steroidobacteraceae bacterium]|nr:winged helix-turn-helix domain-containing protein [Steroidobacteraceae bacterium]
MYEVDLEAGELRKRGVKVNLQKQPFEVLALLISRPGQLLTREELQSQLWLEDALVDSELGLNTAVKKIRTALGDSAENPRFIETLPKRGYRFIAPVQEIQRSQEVQHSQEIRHSKASLLPAAEPLAAALEGGVSAKPDARFVEPVAPSPGRRGRYLLYGILAVISILAIDFVIRQFDAPGSPLSVDRDDHGRAVPVYRTINTSTESAVGIGGYDFRSPADQAIAFDYDHSGKLDHLVLYRPGAGKTAIVKNFGQDFVPIYQGQGIGGYELKSDADRAFAFDYDHSGKLDHLVLYRSGTEILWIVKNVDGAFTPVYQRAESTPSDGNATRDQQSGAEQIFAFDYDHSGKLDYLARYSPGNANLSILKNIGGALTEVYAHSIPGIDIGGDSPKAPASQAFAFDYDHSGKSDHLVIYRPGAGTISILKNIDGTMVPVYQGIGIGGSDLKSPNDRVLAFDYDHSGKSDHLLLYRPGSGLVSVLKNSKGRFAPEIEGNGVGGFDLKSPHDRSIAFDYDHSGKQDHLVFYRSGTGVVCISYFPSNGKTWK